MRLRESMCWRIPTARHRSETRKRGVPRRYSWKVQSRVRSPINPCSRVTRVLAPVHPRRGRSTRAGAEPDRSTGSPQESPRMMSQGQATRSTLTFWRVIQRMAATLSFLATDKSLRPVASRAPAARSRSSSLAPTLSSLRRRRTPRAFRTSRRTGPRRERFRP